MSKQKNNKRKQHYVPKFYLRNFSENNKSIGMYLFKTSKIIEYASINDNLWEEYFYGEDAIVENKLAEWEGRWNDVISSIIALERLPETERHLTWLRYFILISSARTLKRGNQINNDCTTLTKKILEIEEPDLFQRYRNMGEDALSFKLKYPTLPFINVAQKSLPLVIDLKMELLINKSSIDYVTSDNPAVFYNQLFQEKNLSRGFGWGEYGIQFIIPISPAIAICMYDSEVYDIKENILSSDSTVNKLNQLFRDNSDELIIFMHGGNKDVDKEKLNYINKLVERRECSPDQGENEDMITFSNKQIFGRYDLSDIFEIKQKYKAMKISNHSKEEIEQKLNIEMEKLISKLQSMPEDELKKLLESKKVELIGIEFNDMERQWVKIYEKYEPILITLFEFECK